MKFGITLITLLFIVFNSYGQDKKDLAVSISGGLLNSPYYERANARSFYGFDFDYHLTKRHLLSLNYFAGRHSYYDNVLSNAPSDVSYSDGNNSMADYRTASVMYKYKILDNNLVSIVPGTGAGVMTHTLEFPYKEVNARYNRLSSYSELVIPVNLDINFKLYNHWQAGLSGGFLFIPGFPIVALHAGPRLSYIIK